MRLLLIIIGVLTVGALAGLLVGWPFGFSGGAWRWALDGALLALLASVIWLAWDVIKGGRVVPAVLLLLAGVLLHQVPAQAGERLARQGEDWVRFYDRPCTSELVIVQLLPSEVEHWSEASAQFQGKSFAACWREVRGVLHLVYEDGDHGVVSSEAAEVQPGT